MTGNLTQPSAALPRLDELDWNLLRMFLVMAEARSISDAATKLSRRQPTVSAALKRLEAQLGQQLIRRGPAGYGLTDAGRALYREALEVRGVVDRLGVALRSAGEVVRGHVTIAMASHVVCPLFDQALRRFHELHPEATLRIDISSSREAIARVVDRTASFAVCLVHETPARLDIRQMFREYFGLFCGPTHALFGREGLRLDDLRGATSVSFVTDQMTEALRDVTLMRAQAGLSDKIIGVSAHLEEVRRMIIAGLGVGPLPLHVAAEDVAAGKLWQLPPKDNPAAVDVHVLSNRQTRMNRAEQTMLTMLHELIDATPPDQRDYRPTSAGGLPTGQYSAGLNSI